jgi:hypothetical protein
MSTTPDSLADDLLRGADAIAEFIYGKATSAYRQRVYRAKDELPCFKLGKDICARKSTLLRWIAEQEAQ